jgi:hypothetical protein
MCATQPPINDVAALDVAISGFDRIDLLSVVAGLQLLPENAERIVRLEALAYRVASGQFTRSRRIAPHPLRDVCNSPALGAIAHAEDPFDSVFCEEMCFHGGSYRVLPGINEHATFILKRLLESLFFHLENFPDREGVARVHVLRSADMFQGAGGNLPVCRLRGPNQIRRERHGEE